MSGKRRRSRRSLDTLVLLDHPTADGLPGPPISAPGRPAGAPGRVRAFRWRRGRPWRRGTAIAAAVGVATAAAAGMVILRSHAAGGHRAALPDIAVVPTFPQVQPVHSASPAASRSARPTRTTKASAAPSQTAAQTVAQTASPAATARAGTVTVTYRVDKHLGNGFQAEIDVVNNESQPISGWQIVVALQADEFQSWWNATGYVSNGILLLYQPSGTGPIPAGGGTLRVYFVASGSQTTPQACAFDGIDCS
jgi:hypothetical protein